MFFGAGRGCRTAAAVVRPSPRGSELPDTLLVSVFLPLKRGSRELEVLFHRRVRDSGCGWGSPFPASGIFTREPAVSPSTSERFPPGRFPPAPLRRTRQVELSHPVVFFTNRGLGSTSLALPPPRGLSSLDERDVCSARDPDVRRAGRRQEAGK